MTNEAAEQLLMALFVIGKSDDSSAEAYEAVHKSAARTGAGFFEKRSIK
jgi:hypothetical protein